MTYDILFFVAKYITVSAVLWSLFELLFRGKASFNAQRIYLLAIPVLAFFMALMSVDLIKVEDTVLAPVIQTGEMILDNFKEIEEKAFDNGEAYASTASPQATKSGFPFSTAHFLIVLWLVVSLILISKRVSALNYIRSLRALSSKSEIGECTLYRSGLVETPFSFQKSVFINRVLDGDKLVTILSHEMSHISHRHYIDVAIMQFCLVFMWFNPFVWLAFKNLGAVHEYQADEKVAGVCTDIKKYKLYLFEEAGYKVPIVANGFNNSLIKQRFIMLHTNYKVTHRKLRLFITLPFIVLSVTACSLVYVDTEIYINNVTAEASTQLDKQTTTKRSNTEIWNDIVDNYMYSLVIPGMYDMVEYTKSPINKHYVYRYDDRTEFVSIVSVFTESQWVYLSSDFWLEDIKTGDSYKAQSVKGGAPFDKFLIVRENIGDYFMFVVTFPPLPKGVNTVHVKEAPIPERFRPTDANGGWDIQLKVYDGYTEKPYEILPIDDEVKDVWMS